MSNPIPFDVRIVNFINRKLNNYLIGKESRKRQKSEKAWKEKFKSTDYFLHELGDNLKIRLYQNSVLSKYIYDGFETAEIEFLKQYLKSGDYFLDIGANIGLFSLIASRIVGENGKVLAFEPSKLAFKRLLENCSLNKIQNVEVFKIGLSDEEAELELNVSDNGYDAWNTFVQAAGEKFTTKEKVQVKSLDHFLAENNVNPDKISLVKLDVEGFELNVLKGAERLLKRDHSPVFMIEYTDSNAIAAGHCCHEIYRMMNQFGFNWYSYSLEKNALIPEPIRSNYPYENLIAIKDPSSILNLSQFKIAAPQDAQDSIVV